MIEKNWTDFICYSIHFTTKNNRHFCRTIGMPINFPKDMVGPFFLQHFERNEIRVITVKEELDIWLSKNSYELF